MKSVDSQVLRTPVATTFLWNIVVSGDSGLKIGIASSLYDAENIAFSFLDETRASFLSWCDYHARSVDKEAFFDFIEMSKSEFEQVHIELMEIPLPKILAGEVISTNVIEFQVSAEGCTGIGDSSSSAQAIAPSHSGTNVIAFPASRDPKELCLDRAIEQFLDERCSEDQRNEAISTVLELAFTPGATPVGRRAAEWASLWLYA